MYTFRTQKDLLRLIMKKYDDDVFMNTKTKQYPPSKFIARRNIRHAIVQFYIQTHSAYNFANIIIMKQEHSPKVPSS